MEEIILTDKLIEAGLTEGVGIQQRQADVLGISIKKGWKRCMIGKKVTKEIYELFVALKDKSYTPTSLDDYNVLLQRKEWKSKRLSIIKRDGRVCAECGSTNVLQVHHLYYYKERILPWLYPNDCYVTLCRVCHQAWHEKNSIVIKNKPTKKKQIKPSPIYNDGHLQQFVQFLLRNSYLSGKGGKNHKNLVKEFLSKKR